MSYPSKPYRWPFTLTTVNPKWHWVFKDLVALVPAWEMDGPVLDYIGGGRSTDAAAATASGTNWVNGWTATEKGPALFMGGNNSAVIVIPNQQLGKTEDKLSTVWVALCLSSAAPAGAQPRRTLMWGAGDNSDWLLGYNDLDETITGRCRTSPPDFTVQTTPAVGTTPAGKTYVAALTYDGGLPGDQLKMYQDGVLVSMGSLTGNIGSADPFLRIGNAYPIGDARDFRGSINIVYMWHRGLTAGEVITLSQDPFGPLRQRDRYITFPDPNFKDRLQQITECIFDQ